MSDCGCETALGKLEDLLRDELCAEESKPIRDHLESCPECNAEKNVCITLTEAIQRACRDKAPATLRDEILASLNLKA